MTETGEDAERAGGPPRGGWGTEWVLALKIKCACLVSNLSQLILRAKP